MWTKYTRKIVYICIHIPDKIYRAQYHGQNILVQNIPGQNSRAIYTTQNISGQNIPDKIYSIIRTRTKYTKQSIYQTNIQDEI